MPSDLRICLLYLPFAKEVFLGSSSGDTLITTAGSEAEKPPAVQPGGKPGRVSTKEATAP